MAQYSVGVDLGGQSVKLGVVDESGTIHIRQQSVVDARLSSKEMAAFIISEIQSIQSKAKDNDIFVSSVGFVMPGYMDRRRSKLVFAANLPTLGGSDFLNIIREGIERPVIFDADCNAAAWGEYHFGAGQEANRLVVTTVGTGIGAGVIIDDKIVRTFYHVAGSLGHVIVDPQGLRCSCGARGCLETRASGLALERRAMELARKQPDSRLAHLLNEQGRLTGVEIGTATEEGDPVAVEVVSECGWWLGAGIASWTVIFKPQRVLIGGGIASLGDPYFDAIRRGFAETGMPELVEEIRIEPAAMGQDAGIVGAAALAMLESRLD